MQADYQRLIQHSPTLQYISKGRFLEVSVNIQVTAFYFSYESLSRSLFDVIIGMCICLQRQIKTQCL